MLDDWSTEGTVLLVSLAIVPALLVFILLCLKIKTSKSNPDLFGVEGTVKKKQVDEAYTPSNKSGKLDVSVGEDSNVRTPSYDRKLPDIPNDDLYKNSTKEDNNSELYATVDEVPNNNNNTPLTHPNAKPGTTNSYNDPKNHPYAKVKKARRQEHPYAKVGESSKDNKEEDENTDTEEYDTTENMLLEPRPQSSQRSSGRSQTSTGGVTACLGTWVPPPRRPDEPHPRNPSRQATPLPPEPPFPSDNSTAQGNTNQQPQQHFSGDSQDSFSAKGYTSISVREPLSMIRTPGQQVLQESNYVTLSETSDEMYAAIEDTVYTNPRGEDSSNPNSLLYSKVDKIKKKSDRQTKSYDSTNNLTSANYATVNKTAGAKKYLSQSSDNLGARPKHRSPRPSGSSNTEATATHDNVDYSEYEVSHTDRYSQRDLGYETVNHQTVGERLSGGHNRYTESQLTEPRDPGYEVVTGETIHGRASHPPDYESVPSELKLDPGYETVTGQVNNRNRINSIDPGYETVPHKPTDPGYETVPGKKVTYLGYETVSTSTCTKPSFQSGPHNDPGYETVPSGHHVKRHSNYGPRSYPPDYESVGGFRDPGYETVPHTSQSHSLEPGYETLPGNQQSEIVRYSKVNKKQRAAPPARLPPQARFTDNDSDIYLNYETLPETDEQTSDSEEGEEVGGGYETIPADQERTPGSRHRTRLISTTQQSQYDPGYETLPATRGSEAGYETIPAASVDRDTEGSTDPDYARLKDADFEFIDESADELDDEICRLQTEAEDVRVESTQSSSLIHMSVVDSGVRRSSVVVIEHVDMTPVHSADLEESNGVNSHIFV